MNRACTGRGHPNPFLLPSKLGIVAQAPLVRPDGASGHPGWAVGWESQDPCHFQPASGALECASPASWSPRRRKSGLEHSQSPRGPHSGCCGATSACHRTPSLQPASPQISPQCCNIYRSRGAHRDAHRPPHASSLPDSWVSASAQQTDSPSPPSRTFPAFFLKIHFSGAKVITRHEGCLPCTRPTGV